MTVEETSVEDRALEAALTARLEELSRSVGVAGAVVAVQRGTQLFEAAYGVTSTRTGVPVTPDTLFQVGSITKLYTAALVMQLIDEERLDLTSTVDEVLPEVVAGTSSALAAATVQQLLTHASGLQGDVFDDVGRDDGCLRRHVELARDLSPADRPGRFSYCNSGYVVLGRVVEHLRGMSWDRALKHFLLQPLGLVDTVTLPEEALLRTTAVGHSLSDGSLAPTRRWAFPRALGPAAGVTAPAREVLRFAQALADEGRADSGERILSPSSARRMLVPRISLDAPYPLAESWGLGWVIYRANTPQVIGHDGSTIGQQAFLRLVPERDLAVVLLASGAGGALSSLLLPELLAELAFVTTRRAPQVPVEPVTGDWTPFLGRFERYGMRLELRPGSAGRVVLATTLTGSIAGRYPAPEEQELVMLDDRTLITSQRDPHTGTPTVFQFSERLGQRYMRVHSSGRMTPRAEE